MIPPRHIVGRILKWSAIAALGVVLIAGVTWALAFAINTRDEDLTPATRALLAPPPDPYRTDDNVYLAIAGFDAPAGESAVAVGQARVRHFNGQPDPPLNRPAASVPDAAEPAGLTFKGAIEFCQPLTGSVWTGVPPHAAEVEQLRLDNAELYQRYLALLRMGGYYETARPSYATPMYTVPKPVRQLFLAELVLRLRNADAQVRHDALADLAADQRLWRAVLTGHGALLSKMLAVANLQADSLLVGDLAADAGPTMQVNPMDADGIAPVFALQDWNISEAYAEEFRFQVAGLRETRVENRQAHFFKLQATENLFAASTSRLIAAASADPAHFAPGSDPASEAADLWTVRLVYNPIGRILASVARPDYNYTARAWDGAALQRLVRASFEIRRQRIDAADIPGFLRSHPQWSTHPAGGRPFHWDAKTGVLSVQTVARQPPDRRFSVHLWPDLAPPAPPR